MMKRQDLEFRAHLEKVDREFLAVAQTHPPLSLPIPRPPFEALIRIVTGQQLSVKAAESVFQKMVVQLNGVVTVNSMLQQGWRSIQSCGLSRSKLNCIQELVEFAGANELELNRWLAKDWNDLRTRLLEIKGIGPFIEEKLNALGIFKFSQIAKMTSEIEEEVNVAIEFFPGRVKRDEWVKQAAELAK